MSAPLTKAFADQTGTRLPIGISAPTLTMPQSIDTPVILVGPGTGVAPMRAFLEYRIAQGAGPNTTLYFGCRSAKADLYYAEEWEAMRKQGVRVEVAASRDQEAKIYVQDLIKKDKDLIQEWVQQRRGHVYISG
jgi:sulfite reductase alpha subunit-like flavoprotein